MTASAVFERPLSMADLGYISFGYRSTDIDQDVSQSVIEGKGVIDEAELQRAVSVVAKALPACQFVLTGTARARHWKAAGPLPEVRTIHRDWDGHYREDLDFLERTFDLCRGPVAEVVQVVSRKTFFVFTIYSSSAYFKSKKLVLPVYPPQTAKLNWKKPSQNKAFGKRS